MSVTAAAVRIDRGTGAVQVDVLVQEGRRWLVDALQFALTDGSAAPDIPKAVHLGAPWNMLWRQDVATALRRWYYTRRSPSTIPVTLTPQPTPRPDGTTGVTVVAAVIPGPVVHTGQVKFQGNHYTQESILRRLVKSNPGDLLNPIRFDNSEARISRLGVFRTVDLRYEPADGETRDVVYDLVEGRRQEVSLFAGWGSYEEARGGVEWQHYNLFGLAHSTDLKLIESMKSSEGTFTYTVPGLFGSTLDDGSRRSACAGTSLPLCTRSMARTCPCSGHCASTASR